MATYNPVEIIRKKRDGKVLTDEEIGQFVADYSQGKLPDYQASALLTFKFNRQAIQHLVRSAQPAALGQAA